LDFRIAPARIRTEDLKVFAPGTATLQLNALAYYPGYTTGAYLN